MQQIIPLRLSYITCEEKAKTKEFLLIFREWFESEQSKLTKKFGRYCTYNINYTNAISIVKEHINYFSIFQLKNKLLLRIDGMLIKPIQRLTRYCDKNSYSIQSNNNLNNTRKSRSQSSERTLSFILGVLYYVLTKDMK